MIEPLRELNIALKEGILGLGPQTDPSPYWKLDSKRRGDGGLGTWLETFCDEARRRSVAGAFSAVSQAAMIRDIRDSPAVWSLVTFLGKRERRQLVNQWCKGASCSRC